MILYLDTSSLLKLYVEESGTADVQAGAESAEVVATSVVAYPEGIAAVARRHREGALSPGGPGPWLSPTGFAGAIHLACYVDLLGAGEPVEFLSHDARLHEAAARERRAHRTQP